MGMHMCTKNCFRPPKFHLLALTSVTLLHLAGCGTTSYIPIAHQEYDSPDVPGKNKVYAAAMISSGTKVTTIKDNRAMPPISSGSDFSETNSAYLKLGYGLFDRIEVSGNTPYNFKAKWQFLGSPMNQAVANEFLGSVYYKYEYYKNNVRDDDINIFGNTQTITESEMTGNIRGIGLSLGYRLDLDNTIYLRGLNAQYSLDSKITQDTASNTPTIYKYTHSGTQKVATLGFRNMRESHWFWGFEVSRSNTELGARHHSSTGAGIYFGRKS